MCILCQKCNDVRLGKQERKEASKRNNSEQGGTKNHVKDDLGDLQGMDLLIASQGLRLIFIVWIWTKTLIGSQ